MIIQFDSNAVGNAAPIKEWITATGSRRPVVPPVGEWWKGKTLIGIGSYKPDMRELPHRILKELKQLFVDTEHGLSGAGDLLMPLKHKLITENQILSISELIMKRVTLEGDTRFFKSVGTAAFDLYGAKLVFDNLS